MQLMMLAMIRFNREAGEIQKRRLSNALFPRAARNLVRTNSALGRTLADTLALPA
jgi:hypothetical protein